MRILLAALLAGQAQTPDPVLARMVVLYDEVCLKTFPIDAAVEQLMTAKGAVPMPAEQVRATFGADPAKGWLLRDGDRDLMIAVEAPPFHACAIRRTLPALPTDLSGYDAIAARFAASHRGFAATPGFDGDRGDVHIHALQRQRSLPGGGYESLQIIDQHVTDPAKRAAGQVAVDFRFVHQIVSPEAR